MEWDRFSLKDWAIALGMAKVPWLSASDARPGHAVLLDGPAGSFAMSDGSDQVLSISSAEPLSWAWSSNLRHVVVLSKITDEVLVRRWDKPKEQLRLSAPQSPSEVELFAEEISQFRPKNADVVLQLIAAFKTLRSSISVYPGGDNLTVVKTFNLLLTAAENPEFRKCRLLGDVLSCVEGPCNDSLTEFKGANIEGAIDRLLNSSPPGVPRLKPSFLIRHASGQLYQEAHFELERQFTPGQLSLFGGLAPNDSIRGISQRDARFTPTPLARSLVEQAWRQLGDYDSLEILDPACGCGVFLHEALRVLTAQRFTKPIRLRGFDSSSISVEIAKFCLAYSANEAIAGGMNVTVEVTQKDALKEDWGKPSLVLMNPPFVSYRDMSDDERETVKGILGTVARGHYDKSMAFIWKAANCIDEGGVIASVIPSVLLNSSNGQDWRSALLEKLRMQSVGQFKGYSYFPGALVEPAYIVMSGRNRPDNGVTILIADEGREDLALRLIRKQTDWPSSPNVPGVFIAHNERTGLTEPSWLPKTSQYHNVLLSLRGLPKVSDIFVVHQGALTGNNRIFVLSDKEFATDVPESEKRFFRPAAGTTTIVNGQIERREFVFFPYDEHGLTIHTEDELRNLVPKYYASRLEPGKLKLQARSDKTDKWWELIRARTWQLTKHPKIVTAYFGTSGHFAYDDTGEYVCLHGYAWIPIQDEVSVSVDTDDDDLQEIGLPFDDTDFPWAYLAILNSRPFKFLLSLFCTRVQGGQFNLSKRFVKDIPIPDLQTSVPGDLISDLSSAGRNLGESVMPDSDELSALVGRAYGVSGFQWGG